ncbi:MarR family winged helix-turn-helix transcriptional regulator [Paenibacillus nasutitermitis]|uniref:HTH-type transcriptional regulator YcgE n=1 Tax=Paenibacillus nasutitermitis TaxID=1652958 RepID=A0A916ZHG4_9BACL|nr:MarR family transcriptional regulator [Paenibacillus nasutitermitis]GGD96347.1 putative HTH-type transcriptional regulator YcgE [Paenibacillus nasutitermitis]
MSEPEHRKALMSQMQFLGQMLSTETALFHQAAAAKLGLGITDLKTISTLLQEGPMTAGQLSQRLNLTTGAVSNLIDRLEQRKFVKRAPDSKDRRKVIITAIKENLAPSDHIYRSMGDAFERLLETYTTGELEFLVRYNQATIELTMLESAKLTKLYRKAGDIVDSE